MVRARWSFFQARFCVPKCAPVDSLRVSRTPREFRDAGGGDLIPPASGTKGRTTGRAQAGTKGRDQGGSSYTIEHYLNTSRYRKQ